MRARLSLLVVLVAVALVGPGVLADVVYLTNGKVIEGRVTEDGDRVVVEIAHGTVSFPRSRVLRIEKKESSIDVFDRRHAVLDAGDTAGRMELAEWCRGQGLADRRLRVLREVLALEADHAEARRQMGFVLHEGRWMTPEEQYRAQGMVQFEGAWHKPETVEVMEKARADTARAVEERRKAQIELEIRSAEAERLRAEIQKIEAERERAEAERARLDAERRRLETTLLRHRHFKVIGNSIYYYPEFPDVRRGVLIVQLRSGEAVKDAEADGAAKPAVPESR